MKFSRSLSKPGADRVLSIGLLARCSLQSTAYRTAKCDTRTDSRCLVQGEEDIFSGLLG